MEPSDVLEFWLGPLDAQGRASPEKSERWWRKDAAFDAEVRTKFGPTWHELMAGKHDDWLATPHALLAYVLVLDQLSRNMFRGEARAFAGDARALTAAQCGISRHFEQALIGDERVFLYMPFMHSEELAMQERCITLFARFRDECSGPLREAVENNLRFAEAHRDIVARWGRFPHRNVQLGRTSTPEELAFLKQPNSSF